MFKKLGPVFHFSLLDGRLSFESEHNAAPTLGISGGAKLRLLHAVATPLPIQTITRCAQERSCLSLLPSRAAPERVLLRQEEIAAR
jgi:hypothetical protein